MRLIPVLLALTFLSHAVTFAGDEFRSADQGFRIERPGDGWQMAEFPPPAGATYAMKVARGDGGTETSVTVYIAERKGVADAKAARDLAEARHRADPKSRDVRRGSAKVAGEPAPWVEFRYDVAQTEYTLRQHYQVHHDVIFIVQSAAPTEVFADQEKALDGIVATFAFIERTSPEDLEKQAFLKKLAERCGSELDWAADWKEAAARAAKEQKLVFVIMEEYRGVVGDRYAPSTLLMDSDVVSLINERLVPLWWTGKTEAPFNHPSVYGLGPSTFGQGTLFVTAEGKVVAAGVSFNPFYFDDFARAVLRDHPGAAAADAQDPAALLRRGDFDAAGKLLAEPKDAHGWLLRADLLRRQRRGADALAALARAREPGARDCDLPEAVVRLRMGDLAAAERLLRGRTEPEARFWLAIARGSQLGLDAIRAELDSLAHDHPGDRWAWRAAAILCGKGFASGLDRASWPEEERLAGCAQTPPEPAKDLASAERDAVAFLLASQLRDGSWPSPATLAEPRGADAVAIASICGSALLPHRDVDGAGAAVDRAVDFVLKNELRSDADRLFDYTIWGQIFSLRFLAECSAARIGDRARLKGAMNALVRALKRDRRAGGGWAYFRLEGREDASIGFVTAAALISLREAKAAGADVPDDLLETAEDTLLAMRTPSGAFTYMREPRADVGAREAEASLRSPLYALALHRGGRADLDGVRAALAIYEKHHAHTRVERGKGLCHTGPEGTASYYLLYGYAFAAEALASIPPDERAGIRQALEEDLLYLRTADGSFCDNPMMGRHVGTGLALRAIRGVRKK